jgi:hypothetical protein
MGANANQGSPNQAKSRQARASNELFVFKELRVTLRFCALASLQRCQTAECEPDAFLSATIIKAAIVADFPKANVGDGIPFGIRPTA